MELSYDEIRRIHREEKNSTRLVEVPGTFYNDLSDFIKKERNSYLDSLKDFSIGKARNFTNMKKMVEEIFSMREKKILSRALISSRTGEISKKNMATHEEKIYNKIVTLLKKHNALLDELFSNGEAKVKESQPKGLKEINVKITAEIPSFVGADMKEYGPYPKGQSAQLPYKVAKLLISRKLAKEE